MFNLTLELTAARARLHASIDKQCTAAHLEIAAMAKQAMKDIRRSASFDKRSAGQKRRRNNRKMRLAFRAYHAQKRCDANRT